MIIIQRSKRTTEIQPYWAVITFILDEMGNGLSVYVPIEVANLALMLSLLLC